MLQFTKRALSAFLALVMVFTMLPLQVWAEEVGSQDSDNSVNLAGLYGGVKAEEKVAARIDLDAASALLPVGQTHTFTPTLYDENGGQMEGADYVWTSSNPEIATVSGGQVTGVKEGVATITCQYGSLQTEAMVTVTAASYQLTYVIDYPTDAKKFAYNSGVNEGNQQENTQGAVIITPSDTSITESYAPGTVVTIPDNLATTINYRLTGFIDEQGKRYSIGSPITLNSNIKLTSTWEKIVDEGTTDKMPTIKIRYHSAKANSSNFIDKIVSVMASEPVTNRLNNKQTRTITFMTANIQDTLGLIDEGVKHRDVTGWRINGKEFGFNSQATVTIERSKGSWGRWEAWPSILDVYPVKENVESGKAVAQFYIRKQSHTGDRPIDKTDYYSVGTGIVNKLPNGVEKIEGDDVKKYIDSAPSLTQIANLMNETIPAGAAIRWYKLQDTDNGYHVDGEIIVKGRYWNVKFVDPDNNKVMKQLMVEDLATISPVDVFVGTNLNTDLRKFKHWSFERDGAPADLNRLVSENITLYAVFERYTGYTVRHLREDLNGKYEVKDTETFRAKPGDKTNANAMSVEGFTAEEFDQKEVTADGKTTIDIRYKRNSYNVIYTITGDVPTGVSAPEAKTYKFEQTVGQEDIFEKTGYSFVGWTEIDQGEKPSVDINEEGKFSMPARNVTFTGSFSVPEDQRYAVKAEIYFGNSGKKDTVLLDTKYEKDLTWAQLNEYKDMKAHELANHFWDNGLTTQDDMYSAHWEPQSLDPSKQWPDEYHVVRIYLKEGTQGDIVFTLTYDANAGKDMDKVTDMPNPQSEKYLKGTVVTVSAAQPKRENYTFKGWTTKQNDPETVATTVIMDKNITLYALWTAKTAEYKVQYLFQKADGSGYEQREDVLGYTASGNIGDTIKPTKLKDIPTGFDYKSHDTDVEITANGEAEANVYYDRLTYTISWTVDGKNGQAVKEEKTLRFEETIGDKGTNPADPTPNAGYRFAGWKIENPGMTVLPGTMPAENIVITGSYAPIDYKVKYVAEGEVPEAYTKNPTVDNTVYHVDDRVTVKEDPSIPGYNFEGWYTKEDAKVTVGENDATFDMPAGDVTLYGKFSKRTDLAYTVKYIWNGEILNTESGTGTFGDPIDPEVKDFEGYTFKDKQTGVTITADETKNVVEVYYYKNVTLTANSDNNRIYNGKTQTAEPGYVSSEENAVFEGIVPTGSGKDAKEYPITFPDDTIDKVDKTKWYIVKEVEDGKLTINPKPVTLSTGDASRDYNGNPLTKDGVAGKEDFVAGDVTEVRATGTQTLVGESVNTIKITWAKGALATNYTITEELGTLTVTAPKDFDYVQKTNREGNYTVGQTVEFTITVKNIYDVDATVQLNEQKDMTITGVDDKGQDTLPAGETKTYSVSHEVTEADVEAGQIANNVTWTLTPHDEDIPPVKGDDESIIKNESYLVWYVLEGDTEGCINLDTMPKQANHKYGKTVTVWMPELAEGYKFSGWTVEGAEIVDGEVADEAGFKMPENAVILTGTISKEQVKVTYAAEAGGLVTDPKSGLTSKSFVETLSYGANAQGAVAVANEGYTFLGWKQDNAFVEQDEVIAPKEVKETVTYTAVFAKNYTVTYQIEGEKGAYETQTHYAGEADVEVLGNAPAKTGYDFSGWKTEDTAVLNGKFTMPEQDVLFTGSYTAHTNLVWYVLEGDTKGCTNILEMPKQANYAYDTVMTVWMPELAEGYKFSGWTVEGAEIVDGKFSMPDNAVILTGTISKEQVKVDYKAQEGGLITDSNGLSDADLAEMVPYGENAKGATASAKPGYYFVRWVDAEGNEVGTELSFAPENVTKEAVYKAVFAKYYAVNYVPVGTPEGTDLPQPENPYRAGDEVVLMDAPKVDGYKFEGWYKDANCTEEAENFVMPAEDVTIYGKFERAYKVTYRLNDGKNQFGINDKGYVIPHDFEPIAPTECKAGEVVKVAQEQILVDVDFSGWRCIKGNVEVENGQFTMPAEDVVFEGYYMNRGYVESHHFQDLYDQQKYKTWSGVIPTRGKEIGEMTDARMFTPNEMAIYVPEVTPEHVHLREPIVQKEILPFRKTVVDIYYDRDWYDVTYQLEGDVIPDGFTVPETKQHAYTATVTVAKAPQIAGYTFTGWTTEDAAVANGKFAMPNNAVTLTGKFELATDTKYTVEHYFENLGGGYPAEPNHTESKAGTTSQRTEAMPIPAGSITGFTVDGSWKQQTIKPDGSTVVKIYYTRNSYNLTVHYRNVGGAAVTDSHHGTYKFGETWKVVSPIVAGYYDPQIRSISSGANGMPAQDLEYVVIYTAIPVPAPDPGPGPAPNPGPDDGDDDDGTPPVPNPEQEQPPQPQDFEIDPDDYTLTEVEDNETPLANLNLEGHTCCILHLLLMLAAMVVLGFDTKSRKKHQARIFELKKMLAMEEDHSDDPEQP